MSHFYLYTDEVSRDVLLGAQQKIILIGGDFGYSNFGDVLQHVNSLNFARKSKRFSTVSVMAASAIGSKEFPEWASQSYATDAIIYIADYPLILDEASPTLVPLGEIRNLSIVHLYGGGFLNAMWGDFVLGVTEYFLNLAPHARYVVSGQQITPPYQSRVARHIEAFKPALFGVRDELSSQCLNDAGFAPQFSFDDATETLVSLAKKLPMERGAGLLMHLNVSDYTANDSSIKGLRSDLKRLSTISDAQAEVTLFQAFRDSRQEVVDSREALKYLDIHFPFNDVRMLDLAALAYGEDCRQITRPIRGELGYSCSYHVTLWLQLAGIPCWLRSSNPFYDQKSKALQVTQDLESFLKAPRLADHRSNLDRRAQWLDAFEKVIESTPEVRQVCKIAQPEGGPAPWPFFFKGSPTLEEKLDQANKDSRDSRLRAEAAEGKLHQLHEQNLALNERIQKLSAHLTEVGNEAHTQRQRAEILNERIQKLSAHLTEVGNEAHTQRQRAEMAEERLLHSISDNQQPVEQDSRGLSRPMRALVRYFEHGHFDAKGHVGLYALAQKIGRRLPIPVGLRSRVGRLLTQLRRKE
ncbi:hypothetical protein [Pseudomonas fluorescens]|uniref:hypothetical protein n=1 Tax=Pseudomonas fluorescens TaxID=294 RepID=UPI0012402D68|nr:hypothetical protein [Pseudomonas fluorescens]VVN35076.1 hypothetical protein PS639_05022 [Pseudomonas fluorescens]